VVLNCLCGKPEQTAVTSFMQCEMLLIDVSCFVVMLQNCGCLVEGAACSCLETHVRCDVGGTEAVRIKVEETIDSDAEIPEPISFPPIKIEEAIETKDEIPEDINFPPIKTEDEVRLWGVCEVVADQGLGHLLLQ
jgi:hypothetical protein